ncbi:MAG: hypothetical protein J6R45_02000 [Clostridia bacterium]|nr:hypothetical protein [Clostridia bacterium]
MKKLALILAAALIALSFASCANNNDVIDDETTVEDTTVEETTVEETTEEVTEEVTEEEEENVPSNVTLSSELYEIIAAVENGAGIEATLMVEPISDPEMFAYMFFTPYVEGAEGLVSQPMIGAIPHFAGLIRLPEGADVNAVVEDIKANADPRKWICVEAEKVVVEARGNVVLFVMSSTATADVMAENFQNIAE